MTPDRLINICVNAKGRPMDLVTQTIVNYIEQTDVTNREGPPLSVAHPLPFLDYLGPLSLG